MYNYNYRIYTPETYALEMAKISIDKCFETVEKNRFKDKLESIKIIDLSCGSGNLLLPALKTLITISKNIYGEYRYKKSWVTGFDIDEVALALFKKRFDELLNRYGLEGELDIRKEDSLFKNFEEKYDIVLGNPPYLGEKNHKEIFSEIRKTEFGNKYYNHKMDYFYFFIDKAVDILKEDGVFVYLTTNYWFKADSAAKLRKRLKNDGSFFKIENFNSSLFKDAKGQHNVIFSWIKSKDKKTVDIVEKSGTYRVKHKDLFFEDDDKIVLITPNDRLLIDNIKKNSNFLLKDLLNVNQGIVSGADKVFVFDEFKPEFKDFLKPFYKNKDIGKYNVTETPPFWIIYTDGNKELDSNLYNYLLPFKETLSKRREVSLNRINWWELQWSRDEDIFLKPKIVVGQRSKTNSFGYSEKEFYSSADVYYLTKKNEDINLFYILGYLNSKVFFYWFKYVGKQKGKSYDFYATPLKESPIYYADSSEEREYIETLVKKQIEMYSERTQTLIDNYFISKLSITDIN